MKDFERKYTYHSLWAMRRVGYSELREEELEERINKKIEEISYKYSTWWGSPSPDQVRERDEKIEEIKREAQ